MLRSIFASLLTIIFDLIFSVTLTVLILLTTLLNLNFYKGEIPQSIYNASLSLLDFQVESIYKNSPSLPISKEALKKEVTKNMNPKDFENLIVSFVEQVINPVFDKDGIATITLDFSSLYKNIPSNLKLKIPTTTTFNIDKEKLRIAPGLYFSKDLLWNFFYILCLINVLLLAVIGLIIFRPLHKVLRWISKPLISSAVLMGILFFVVTKLPDFLMNNLPLDEKISADYQASIMSIFKTILTKIASISFVYVGVIFGVGVILYTGGLIWKLKSKSS